MRHTRKLARVSSIETGCQVQSRNELRSKVLAPLGLTDTAEGIDGMTEAMAELACCTVVGARVRVRKRVALHRIRDLIDGCGAGAGGAMMVSKSPVLRSVGTRHAAKWMFPSIISIQGVYEMPRFLTAAIVTECRLSIMEGNRVRFGGSRGRGIIGGVRGGVYAILCGGAGYACGGRGKRMGKE